MERHVTVKEPCREVDSAADLLEGMGACKELVKEERIMDRHPGGPFDEPNLGGPIGGPNTTGHMVVQFWWSLRWSKCWWAFYQKILGRTSKTLSDVGLRDYAVVVDEYKNLFDREMLVERISGSHQDGPGSISGNKAIWWAFWRSKSSGPCCDPNLVGLLMVQCGGTFGGSRFDEDLHEDLTVFAGIQ